MRKSLLCLFFSAVLILPFFAISNKNIEDMSLEELRIYRNLQYAHHGYKFKSPDLQEYFSQFDWYEEKESNEGITLTKEEERIVNECLKLEKQKKNGVSDLESFFKDVAFNKESYTYGNNTYYFAYNQIDTIRDSVNYDKLPITSKAVFYKTLNGKINPLLVIEGNKISTNDKLLFEAKLPGSFYGWHIKIGDKVLKVYAQPFTNQGKNTTDSVDFTLNENGRFEKINYQELYKDLY